MSTEAGRKPVQMRTAAAAGLQPVRAGCRVAGTYRPRHNAGVKRPGGAVCARFESVEKERITLAKKLWADAQKRR